MPNNFEPPEPWPEPWPEGQARSRRVKRGVAGGLPLRAIAPNAVTALALCSGLTGIRFAIAAEWERAVMMVLIAGVLDGLDGRIARALRGESRFGAELDSLADAISFGVAPALILYLWTLAYLPRFGWIAALILAVFCALRLARFNARIDTDEQPHKSAGFLTGIPAPAGAGLAMLPMFLWFWSGEGLLRTPWAVAIWTVLVAMLMISSLATFSWSSLRLRRNIRFEVIAGFVVLAAALVTVPWQTLSAVCAIYLALMPFSLMSYARVKRQRATTPALTPAQTPAPPPTEPPAN